MITTTFIHGSAFVDDPNAIGEGTQVWHFCHVMRGARVGRGCVLGQNVFVASGAIVGDRVRVQNNVSIYDGVEIEDDVFLGPSCVLTNVSNPRAEISRRGSFEQTKIRRGATVGANATLVCGVTIGRYALIGAGAVVTHDVPDYALILGVPGRRAGWVGRHGVRLVEDPSGEGEGHWRCPETGLRYREVEGQLSCRDRDEEAPLSGAGVRRLAT